MTSHANCTHPTTKGARNACRGLARTKRIAEARADALMIAVDDQLLRANEIIELGAIVRLRGTYFRILSSKGDAAYLTDAASGNCNCPAGLRRRRAVASIRKDSTEGATVCYHVIAARLKAASYAA